MKGTPRTGDRPRGGGHYPPPKTANGVMVFSTCSTRQHEDKWEGSRDIPSWQLLAETGPELTDMESSPHCVGKPAGTVAQAVREAKREINGWRKALGMEDDDGTGREGQRDPAGRPAEVIPLPARESSARDQLPVPRCCGTGRALVDGADIVPARCESERFVPPEVPRSECRNYRRVRPVLEGSSEAQILGNMQLFPVESGETAHIGAGIG